MNYENINVSTSSHVYTMFINELAKYRRVSGEAEKKLLLSYIITGDIKYKNEVIKNNQPFVIGVAKMMYSKNKHCSLSDLISEGNLGLANAIERFDYTKGFKLMSYAVKYIRGYMLTFAIKSRENYEMMHKDTPYQHEPDNNKVVNGEEEIMDAITLKNLKIDVKRMLDSADAKIAKAIRLKFGIDVDRQYTLDEISEIMDLPKKKIKNMIYFFIEQLRDYNFKKARILRPYATVITKKSNKVLKGY